MATKIFLPLPPAGSYSEFQAYGPAAASFFHPELLIGMDSASQPTSPARAVIRGAVHMFLDPTDATHCKLVLLPHIKTLGDLRLTVGGTVCFTYHWLDAADVKKRLQPILEKNKTKKDKRTKDQRWSDFTAGDGAVAVDGGDALGLTVADAEGTGSLYFGILFPSLFGTKFDDAPDHLKTAIDATKQRRRLDPAAFFKNVKDLPGALEIDSSDAAHPLFAALTYRMLLELRNEWDDPLDDQLVKVDDALSGASHDLLFLASNWGTVDLSAAFAGTTGDFTLTWDKHIFTKLPSGPSAESQPRRVLLDPGHWQLSTIYMAASDGAGMWFGANPGPDDRPPLTRYSENNRVHTLIDGKAALKSMKGAMRSVKTNEHWYYLTAWWLSNGFDLDESDTPSAFKGLTEAMALGGAKVYALAWKQVPPLEGSRRNKEAIEAINTLVTSSATRAGYGIIDIDLPPAGSHHQKSSVVSGTLGALAYVGGVDINPNRLDADPHNIKGAYHDLHCFVDGPAVAEVVANFEQRWNANSDRLANGFPSLANSVPYTPQAGPHYVQVTRTFAKKGGAYSFAPRGEYGTLHAVRRAINRAEKYIYMEEQYAYPYFGDPPGGSVAFDPALDPTGIVEALRNAVSRIEFLVLLMPNHAGVPQDRKRRKAFLAALKQIDETKIHAYYLKRPKKSPKKTDHTADVEFELESENAENNGGTVDAASAVPSGGWAHPDEIYIHTKAWIIDDVYAKIGSANVGCRSLSLDSELDLNIIDGEVQNGRRRFALELRLALWGEHLERPIPEDPAAGFELWKNRPSSSRVLDYEEDKGILPGTDLTWENVMDPFGDDAGGDAK